MPASRLPLRSAARSLLRRILKAKRKAAGFTQAELADRLGRPQSYVAKYESDARRMDVIELIAIARALGVRADEIVTAIEDALPPPSPSPA